MLSELLAEIQDIENEREAEILKQGKHMRQEIPEESESIPQWSKAELMSLIKGIFKYGENEWNELIEEIEVHPQRTPNQLALKWRQIKRLMSTDIKRIRKLTEDQKIITKHEWMIAAI